MSTRSYILVLVVALLMLSFGAWRAIEQQTSREQARIVEDAKKEIAATIRSHTTSLTAADFSSQDRVHQQEIFSKVYASFQSVDFVRAKAWNKDSVVIWSDLAEGIGQKFPENHEVVEAFDGEVVMELNETKSEHFTERQFEKLAEVYVPIVDASNNVIGVLEVYKTTADIERAVNAASRSSSILAIITALVLFGVVAFGLRKFRTP